MKRAVQVGLENYAPSLANVTTELKAIYSVYSTAVKRTTHFVVLGHYQLLDALLDKSLQTHQTYYQ